MNQLFVFLLLVLSLNVSAQNKKVFFAMDDLNPNTINLLQAKGFKEAKIIYGDFLYAKGGSELLVDVFTKQVTKLFPDVNDSGYGVLDWESPLYFAITNRSNTGIVLSDATAVFVNTLKLAKKLRPNVQWGFYGIPSSRIAYKSDNDWQIQMPNIDQVLKNSDVIYPVFYMSSPNDLNKNKDLKNVLALGAKYSKPVLPLVWNRFDTTDKMYRHRLLDSNLFVNSINRILNFSYRLNKISGVIWWGRDSWFYKAYKDTISESPTFEQYMDNYNNRVQSILLNNF